MATTGDIEQDGAAGERLLTARARAFLARFGTPLVAAAWLATRALQIFALSPNQDVMRYFQGADAWVAGRNPYVATGFEYPPLTLAFFALIRLAAASPDAFRRLFAAAMLAVDVGVIALVGVAARNLPTRLPRPPQLARSDATAAMLLTVALTALMRALPLERFDLLMVLAAVGWLAMAWSRRRPWAAEIFLALGICTKVVPLVWVPLHLAWCAAAAPRGAPRLRAAALSAARLAGMVVASTLPLAVALGPDILRFVRYHAERGLQIESLWASALLLAHRFAGMPLSVSYRYGCMEIVAAPVAALAKVATWASAIGLLAVTGLVARKLVAAADRGERAAWLLRGTLAATATTMLLGRMLSTQYILWLAPLFALAVLLPGGPRVGRPLLLGGAVATLLSSLLINFYYGDLVRLHPLPTVLLAARNAILIACVLTAVGDVATAAAWERVARPLRHRAWGAAALGLAALWATVGNLSETTANDIWIQLRSGADILATGQFPATEIYSSTVYGRPFIAHEWLAGVIFAALTQAFGGAGLSFLAAGAALVTFGLLYVSQDAAERRRGWYVPLLLAMVYLVSFRILVRPHIFTIVAQAALIVAIERWRRRGGVWPLALLVPLQLLWVNLHGAAFFGPALVGMLAALVAVMAAFPGLQRGSEARTFAWADAGALAGTAAAMAAACLANPYGVTLLRFSLDLFDNEYAKERIWEWTSPFLASNLHYYWFWLYCAALISLWAAIAVRARQLPLLDAALAAAVTFLSVRANRFVPDLALFAFPIVARSLAHVARLALPAPARRQRPWLEMGLTALLLGNAVTFGFAHSAREHRPAVGWGFGGDMPYQEADLLRRLGARGIIYNEYSDGALLIHELYPKLRVVLDSRIDLYPRDVVDEYDMAYSSPDHFAAYLKRHHVDYVMLFRGRAHPAVLAWLSRNPAWQLLSTTNGRVLYRRRPELLGAHVGAAEASAAAAR